jgi:hypothetical protein
MIEWQSFLTTVLSESAASREGDMDERDIILWSLGRLGNNVLQAVRHAFLDTVFPSVASGIRCLLEIIATIDFVSSSHDNLKAYLESENTGAGQLRIPFQRLLKELGKRDGLPWLDLYQEYSELTHPKLSIVKTTFRAVPDSPALALALYDEWHPADLEEHWKATKLCVDRIATIVIAHFGLDKVLLERLEQLVGAQPFENIVE